jgi:hypothetical protein
MAGKTIERDAILENGMQHIPDLSVQAVLVGERGIDESHLAILRLGHAAVVATYANVANSSNRVSVTPGKIVNSDRSAHRVGFGYITSQSAGGGTGRLDVALKPFRHVEGAWNEVRGYHLLAAHGIETYEPIGVFPAAHSDNLLVITKKRDDLVSLDRDEWVVGRKVTDESSLVTAERNNRTVAGIATVMGTIHSHGIYHRDGQIKNYAATPEGMIGIIDTENLTQRELDDEHSGLYAWRDIEKLVRSLIIHSKDAEKTGIFGVGMLEGLSLRDMRAAAEELIINPYLNSLLAQLTEGTSAKEAEHIADLYDSVQGHFMQDEAWPAYLVSSKQKKLTHH